MTRLSDGAFEEFERIVMFKILEEENETNALLRVQYESAKIIKREFTGAGFFTHFSIPKTIRRAPAGTEYGYGDVVASFDGSDFCYGFVLFIKEGLISSLEGYTCTDSWPENIQTYELKHAWEV